MGRQGNQKITMGSLQGSSYNLGGSFSDKFEIGQTESQDSDMISDWIQTSRYFSRMAGCACSSSGVPENPPWASPIR